MIARGWLGERGQRASLRGPEAGDLRRFPSSGPRGTTRAMNNPYAPPGTPNYPAPPAYGAPPWSPPVVNGDTVTLPKLAMWPPLCVKCGTPAGIGPRVQKYAWVPPWTNLLLLIGLLPAVIIQMILTKRATITHAVCGPCNARWTQARMAWVASLMIPLVGGIAVAIAGAAANSGWLMALGGLLVFPGILILPLTAYFALVKPGTVRVTFMDDREIRLQGIAPAVGEAFRTGW
jgi:hypothetical protein